MKVITLLLSQNVERVICFLLTGQYLTGLTISRQVLPSILIMGTMLTQKTHAIYFGARNARGISILRSIRIVKYIVLSEVCIMHMLSSLVWYACPSHVFHVPNGVKVLRDPVMDLGAFVCNPMTDRGFRMINICPAIAQRSFFA